MALIDGIKTCKKDAQAIPGRFPMPIAMDYFRKLKNIVNEMEKETMKAWETRISSIVKRFDHQGIDRTDSLDDDIIEIIRKYDNPKETLEPKEIKRMDKALKNKCDEIFDSPSEDLEKVMTQLRENHQIKESQAKNIASNMVNSTKKFSINQVDSQIQSISGVQPNIRHPHLDDVINTSIQENVRLIKTIPNKYHDEVERVIRKGAIQGRSLSEIEKAISAAGRHTTNNAKLIARDQVGNVMAAVSKERQTQVGVKHYTWRDSGDSRVRSTHESFDGNTYSWKEGSPEGHPGEPIQCRCVAIPDRQEVLNNFGEGAAVTPAAQAIPQGEQIKNPSYEKTEEWQANLTADEQESIEYYTSLDGYTEMRNYQKNIAPAKNMMSVEWKVQEMSEALYKAPSYKGTVYRGLKKLDDNVYDDILGSNKIKFGSFQSTSRNMPTAKSFATPGGEIGKDYRSIILKIESKTGTDIQDLSDYTSEEEVVFQKGAEFINKGQVGTEEISGKDVPVVKFIEITTD